MCCACRNLTIAEIETFAAAARRKSLANTRYKYENKMCTRCSRLMPVLLLSLLLLLLGLLLLLLLLLQQTVWMFNMAMHFGFLMRLGVPTLRHSTCTLLFHLI